MANEAIIETIDRRLKELYSDIRLKNLKGLDVIKQIRREGKNESSILFYFLTERFLLLSLTQGEVFVSKAILKY